MPLGFPLIDLPSPPIKIVVKLNHYRGFPGVSPISISFPSPAHPPNLCLFRFFFCFHRYSVPPGSPRLISVPFLFLLSSLLYLTFPHVLGAMNFGPKIAAARGLKLREFVVKIARFFRKFQFSYKFRK